jgi:hypothetical protein
MLLWLRFACEALIRVETDLLLWLRFASESVLLPTLYFWHPGVGFKLYHSVGTQADT